MPEGKPPAPVRAFWSGTLTFGLVSIPVDLFAGVRGRQTSMKMVDKSGHPLGREYYSEPQEGSLSSEDIVRGYETDEGKIVEVTDEELEAISPEMSRDIELRRFVPKEQIAPAYYQRPYFLAPSGRSAKAYQLLAHTMQSTGRIGIGTFVMRSHQYLVAILSDGNVLRAETLRFAAELRSPQELGLPERAKVSAKEVQRFSNAVASLARDALDMDELSDRTAAALHDLAQDKAKQGKDVVEAPTAGEEEKEEGGAEVIDLIELLKQRVGPPRRAAPRRSGHESRSRENLESLSKRDLYERAAALHIPGRSKMGKGKLLEALRKAS